MVSTLSSYTSPFDFNGIQGSYNSDILEEYDHEAAAAAAAGLERTQNQMLPMDELSEISRLCSGSQNLQPNKSNDFLFKELQANFDLQTTPASQEMPLKLKNISAKEMPQGGAQPCALPSLELLSNYASGFKKLKGKLSSSSHIRDNSGEVGSKKLSTEDILRIAGARYVQFSDQSYDDLSMVMHPFGYALSGLSEEETRGVELVHLLLAAAEKVGYQQFERASRLLSRCEWIAAERSNPVQRIVCNFSVALRERIDRETGNLTVKELRPGIGGLNLSDHGIGSSTQVTLTCYQRLPFNQVVYLTAIQAMVENIGNASKIHVLDFEIRSGVQWTSLMQALAERGVQRPIQLLKITAVAFWNKEKVEETGKSLASFAESLNLPFEFNVVGVSCFLEIKEDLFEIRNDELLIVYCSFILRIMITYPSCLENLLGVIKNLNPSLLVMIEVEANHNSPSFVNRFIEALFFYSAYFDALETCMDQNTETRTMAEAMFNSGIRNVVAMEGTDRTVRSVKMEVWRAFFSRYKMAEIRLSDQSLYQANLVLKQFAHGSCCTLDKNGESLIIGWKGTPIHSVSVWKFSRERGRAFLNYRL